MVEPAEQTASEFYLSLLPLLSNGSIELLDSKRLTSQLRSLERRTRSGGRDVIIHPTGLHDDLSNSCAGACVMASKIEPFKIMPSRGLVSVDQDDIDGKRKFDREMLPKEKPEYMRARLRLSENDRKLLRTPDDELDEGALDIKMELEDREERMKEREKA